MTDRLKIWKDLEGTDPDPFEIFFLYISGETEENYQEFR
jgi:hypothetical protein